MLNLSNQSCPKVISTQSLNQLQKKVHLCSTSQMDRCHHQHTITRQIQSRKKQGAKIKNINLHQCKQAWLESIWYQLRVWSLDVTGTWRMISKADIQRKILHVVWNSIVRTYSKVKLVQSKNRMKMSNFWSLQRNPNSLSLQSFIRRCNWTQDWWGPWRRVAIYLIEGLGLLTNVVHMSFQISLVLLAAKLTSSSKQKC